jgi:glycosyltransferase involved in cell wall biosynthesis
MHEGLTLRRDTETMQSTETVHVAMLVMSYRPKPMGGAERQCEKLSQQLQVEGVRVTVFTEGGKGIPRSEVIEGVTVYRLYSFLNSFVRSAGRLTRRARRSSQPSPQGAAMDIRASGIRSASMRTEMSTYALFLLNGIWTLGRRRREFHVLHVHIVPWISFVGAVIGKLLRKPVLVKESTTVGLEKFDDYPGGRFMRRFVVRHCYFVAMTREIRKEMDRYGVDPDRIFDIPNGVAVPPVVAMQKRECAHCLFVGNLTQGGAKGVDVLLRAWQTVVRLHPEAVLHIVGVGDWETLRHQVMGSDSLQGVIYEGAAEDLSQFYVSAGIFILPSRREGMSNALLEAMAYGKAIVATRISGSEDLIDDQVHGLLVPPDDVPALAEGILRLLNNLTEAEQMGKRARNRVSQAYTMHQIATTYCAAYQTIVAKETTRRSAESGLR